MRARSTARRQLVARLAVVLVAAGLKLGSLGAGQSAPFDASFRSSLPTITRYEVFVEGGY